LHDLIDAETSENAASLPVTIRLKLDISVVHEVFSRSLAMLARINILSAELARDIYDIRDEMLLVKGPDALLVIDEQIATTFKFYSTTIRQDFGLVCNRDDAVPDPGHISFLAAFQMFDEPHLVGNEDDPAYSVLEVFTCRKYGFMFKSFPSAVRAVFVRMLQIITAPYPDLLGDFVEAQTSTAIAALDLMNHAMEHPQSRQVEANLIRQLDRLNLLVSFALSSLAGLVQVNTRLMKDVDYPVQPALPALPAIIASDFLQTSCGTLVQQIIDNPPLVGLASRWSLSPPAITGEEPTSSDKTTSKLDGITFVSQQLRSAQCIYHMPAVHSPQSEWQEWFQTIRGLLVSFPSMSDKLLISCLTAQIKSHDQRIFGWADKCEYLQHQHGKYSTGDWLEHVQSQVISTSTARAEAYKELLDLPMHMKLVLDCIGLATKIKQLFKLIFPLTITKEREPCTWLQAILIVHNMLIQLQSTGGVCHKAWKLYDEYSSTADFKAYIRSALHYNTQISSELSHQYLSEKCNQLIDAHDQYTQTRDLTLPAPRKSIMAINTGGYAGIKRIRDTSSDGSKKSIRKPGGEGKKSKPVAKQGGARDMHSIPTSAFLVTLKKACANKPELYPPAIRNRISSLPKMDKAQCEAAILAGNCIICQEKHRYRQCPVLKGDGPTATLAKQLLKEYHLVRKVENPLK
jgi:hypothetical protein